MLYKYIFYVKFIHYTTQCIMYNMHVYLVPNTYKYIVLGNVN